MSDRSNSLFEQKVFSDGIQEFYEAGCRIKDRLNARMQLSLTGCSGADRSITTRFTVREWQLNINDYMHGGIMTTAFDMVMGILANYLGYAQRKTAATVNLNVTFLKTVKKDDSLLVSTKVVSAGRRMICLTGEAHNEKTGALISTASSSFLLVERPDVSTLKVK
ncbi:MAG TPA: PaaI family thioesterase [Clostridiales bacterium]|jgi:uncharacterized protein (TIGR00369 family)|nr:PaaI family thioesterase [Clostridiales bacterium]